MVGVPTSQGCHTCIRRKMKCDERRPECGQCLRSKYACAGYYREAVFHNASTDDGPDQASTTSPQSPQRRCKKIEETRSLVPSTSVSSRKGPCDARRKSAKRSKLKVSLPPAIDDREIIKLSFFYSFLQVYLPDLTICNVGRGQPLVSWFLIVPELLQPGDLLSRALTSLAMARIGHNSQDQSLSMQARAVLGSALGKLQMALIDKSLVCREETLAACLALAIFELLEGSRTSLAGWLAHAIGVAKLVQLRGPRLHRTAPAHQLFLSFRSTAILVASVTRKATFLAEPAWKTLPWELETKTIDHLLLDVIVDLPGLTNEFDLIDQLCDTDEAIQRRHGLISRCWDFDSGLKAWYNLMKRQTIVSQYRPELACIGNPVDDPDLGRVFPIAYHFTNIQAANMHLLYWANMTTLHHMLRSTYERLGTQLGVSSTREIFPESGSRDNPCWFCNGKSTAASIAGNPYGTALLDFNSLPQCPEFETMWECARNIAQSMEFCLSDALRLLGPSMVLFPLRCAINVFSHYPGRELKWARAVFDSINHRRGLPVSQRIASVQWYGQSIEAILEEEKRDRNAAGPTCPLDVGVSQTPNLDAKVRGPKLDFGVDIDIGMRLNMSRSPHSRYPVYC